MIIYQGVTLHDCSPGYTMKYHNQQVIASVGKCTWRRLQLNRILTASSTAVDYTQRQQDSSYTASIQKRHNGAGWYSSCRKR